MTGGDMQMLRESLGLTRLKMAEELGVSEQMIWLYEAGRRAITPKRCAQLAQLAQRERLVLDHRAPCPTCQGTGWVPTQGPERYLCVPDAAPAPQPDPEPELARPDPVPDARGPGRPRHIR